MRGAKCMCNACWRVIFLFLVDCVLDGDFFFWLIRVLEGDDKNLAQTVQVKEFFFFLGGWWILAYGVLRVPMRVPHARRVCNLAMPGALQTNCQREQYLVVVHIVETHARGGNRARQQGQTVRQGISKFP